MLAQYDAEVRANPKAPPGLVVERADGVVCLTGYFNFISCWELTPSTVRQAVASQAAHFRSRGEKLMWRVYEHDSPAEISGCLAEEGFEPDAAGTLMIFDLANEVQASTAGNVDIRRVTTEEQLEDFLKASEQAFGGLDTWQRTAYSDRLSVRTWRSTLLMFLPRSPLRPAWKLGYRVLLACFSEEGGAVLSAHGYLSSARGRTRQRG